MLHVCRKRREPTSEGHRRSSPFTSVFTLRLEQEKLLYDEKMSSIYSGPYYSHLHMEFEPLFSLNRHLKVNEMNESKHKSKWEKQSYYHFSYEIPFFYPLEKFVLN